ncbi:MAG TPA: nucleotidyl transferase AbiEii/AbiGii toxin family protein [Chitinophagaceae bacterium]|nr:nucleotidyl transferase AbiEii/AbiGii toxin family protein [Chitinophagaceae bacterium]
MTGWLLNLNEEERRTTIEQAAINCGVVSQAMEKDWWVTLTLKAIFQTTFAPHLLFKGGTSLSKCWKLIERFSEDIDLAIDRSFLKYDDQLSRSKIKQLKKAACVFTSTKLKDAIEQQLSILGVPNGMIQIKAEAVKETQPDKDPQVLYLHYPTLFEPITYLPNSVKIEVSALSLNEPFSNCEVVSLLHEHFPIEEYPEHPFVVRAIDARRTFLEKAFLLHEEFAKTDKLKIDRKSRHLYDLERIMDNTVHGHAAMSDMQLYRTIVDHRKLFYALRWIDYETHNPATIDFIPTGDVLASFEKDYETMRAQMIYTPQPLTFAELMERMKQLQERFRTYVQQEIPMEATDKQSGKNIIGEHGEEG